MIEEQATHVIDYQSYGTAVLATRQGNMKPTGLAHPQEIPEVQ